MVSAKTEGEFTMNEYKRIRQRIAETKLNYPPGTRLELFSMEDPYAPVPPGTRGSVQGVDDSGGILMRWDNGRTLSIIPEEDRFRKLTDQEIAEEKRLLQTKPDCPLIGQNGNIYNLLGIAAQTLREHGRAEQAREMFLRATQSGSYDAALCVIGEYVNITSVDEMDTIMDGMKLE